MPADWMSCAFDKVDASIMPSFDNVAVKKNSSIAKHVYSIKKHLRSGVDFAAQDIRVVQPKGPFHFILCRHAVFMYFNQPLRAAALVEMLKRLVPGGYLVSHFSPTVFRWCLPTSSFADL
jgi:chemotaxis methyl-accepting protein methylase